MINMRNLEEHTSQNVGLEISRSVTYLLTLFKTGNG